MLPTSDQVRAVLIQLGAFSTATDLGDFFIAQGVKGIRAAETECPIARYVRGVCGDAPSVNNTHVSIEVSDAGGRIGFDLPPTPAAFVELFDRSELQTALYEEPEAEEPEAEEPEASE